MAAGGSSGKGLADSGLPLRTDIRASKRSRTFFCWSMMCEPSDNFAVRLAPKMVS